MNINKINFTKLFDEQKALASSKVTTSVTWDKKASYMDERVKHSIYNNLFLSHMNLDGCKSLLDFGCGTGNISLAIADKLSNVYAIDYSKVMIDTYIKNAKENNSNNISTYIKSIDDDWQEIPKCDVVVASRSIYGVQDIEKTLLKLDGYANKRIYLTYKTNFGFYDKKLYSALGRTKTPSPDYIYIVNILYSLGIYASVNFIPVECKYESNTSYEKFLDNVVWELGELNEKELKKLKIYYELEVEGKEDKHAYWAMISWEKSTI